MKRFIAAMLMTASVGGSMLVSTPAFASIKPVKLTVSPAVIYNGDAAAITGRCLNPAARVKITSPALGIDQTGRTGKKLKVQFDAGWGLAAGTYDIKAQCYTLIIPGFSTTKSLTVKHAEPWTPIGPSTPVKPAKPHPVLPGFNPDVVVETGFGGMARFVADHHPAR